MARYQIPPDPRTGDPSASHARKVGGQKKRSSPPWLWIGLGAIVTVLAIAVAVLWVRLLLDIPEATSEPTPTVIVQTAVPTSPPPTATMAGASPAEPTLPAEAADQPVATDVPTPIPEGEIGVGLSVTVVAGDGLFLRAQPDSAGDNILTLMPEGTVLEVIGGPEDDGDLVWWQLRMDDGTEGWGAGQYLQRP